MPGDVEERQARALAAETRAAAGGRALRKVAQPTARRPSPRVRSRRQRRRRDQDRRQEQHREGVFEPAGQVEQAGELQDVEGEQRGGGVVAQPVACRKLDAQEQVDPDRDARSPGSRGRRAAGKPRPKRTPATAAAWPTMASQRRRTSVSRRRCRALMRQALRGRSRTSANRIGLAPSFAKQSPPAYFPRARAVRCRFVNGATLAAENRAAFLHDPPIPPAGCRETKVGDPFS